MPGWRRAVPIMAATAVIVGAIAADVLLSACDWRPTGPSPPPVVTISAAGVSPQELTKSAGDQVEFVNQDNQIHDIRPSPHPAHTGCAELNVGAIDPGQSKSTAGLVGPANDPRALRLCHYHDDTRPDDARFQGTINVGR